MERKAVSGIMLTLLLIGMLTLSFNIGSVKAQGTIYIRQDGSVDPSTAPIQRDGDFYRLTDNITSDSYGIAIERSNMTLDGGAHSVQYVGADPQRYGIVMAAWAQIRNVSVKNLVVEDFPYGIWLSGASNISITRNIIIATNISSVWLEWCSNVKISENNITGNPDSAWTNEGISLLYSSGNDMYKNQISSAKEGITLLSASNCTVTENKLTKNYGGITSGGSNNSIYDNALTGNGYYGIFIDGTNHRVCRNNLSRNMHGIGLGSLSNHNYVYENNITDNNMYGMTLFYASNNTFYHNNLINNGNQILSENSKNSWDDAYPSGGNYWSDYRTRYPNASEIDDSGIWDTPYVIDANNTDNYPLINPWTPTPDINNDGIVNMTDINLVAKAFGSQPHDTNWNPRADLVEDDIIDIFDLVTVAINYGKTHP